MRLRKAILSHLRKVLPTCHIAVCEHSRSSFSEYVIWLRRWLRIAGADEGLVDWNARMRKPHAPSQTLVLPLDLYRERASNMSVVARMKSASVRIVTKVRILNCVNV